MKNRISHKPSVVYQPGMQPLGDKAGKSRQMAHASNSGPISAHRYRKSKLPISEHLDEGRSGSSDSKPVHGIEVKVEDLK